MVRKFSILFITSLLTMPLNSGAEASRFFSKQYPSPNPTKIIKSAKFSGVCAGVTHDPHHSTHFPGTINVISSTSCQGRRVSVETDLYLGSLDANPVFLTSGFTSKQSVAELSTNWKCQIGRNYLITAISYHVDDRFRGAITVNRALVFCGIPKAQKPLPKKR